MVDRMDVRSTPSAPARRLLEAACSLIAANGLDGATIREVATSAGVSIGAVQHHFRTKDDMLEAAFRHVVDMTARRVANIPLGSDVRRNLALVIRELLPLDELRQREAKVYVAFASRAITSPRLAAVQRQTLDTITEQLSPAFAADARREAELLLAVADGLTFDAVTRGEAPDSDRLEMLLDAYLHRVLPTDTRAARRDRRRIGDRRGA